MRHRTESGLSSRSRKFVLLLVFLAVVFGAPARAQKNRTAPASPPKYDLKTEAKFKGTVADLQLPVRHRPLKLRLGFQVVLGWARWSGSVLLRTRRRSKNNCEKYQQQNKLARTTR